MQRKLLPVEIEPGADAIISSVEPKLNQLSTKYINVHVSDVIFKKIIWKLSINQDRNFHWKVYFDPLPTVQIIVVFK